jgi:hypothetical protein
MKTGRDARHSTAEHHNHIPCRTVLGPVVNSSAANQCRDVIRTVSVSDTADELRNSLFASGPLLRKFLTFKKNPRPLPKHDTRTRMGRCPTALRFPAQTPANIDVIYLPY